MSYQSVAGFLFASFILASAAACGIAKPVQAGVDVTVDPKVAAVQTGSTLSFAAAVSGSPNTSVTWAIQEGSAGGSISSGDTATYSAPAQPGTFHLVATSVADTTKSDVAVVTVTQGPPPTLSIAPKGIGVVTNQTLQFNATLTGVANASINWSVQEGGAGGTVSSSGLYTAPNTSGTYHVIATSADNSLTDKATVTVTGAAAGTPGTWQNVTPSGVNMSATGDNFGAQDAMVDPARKTDVYAFVTYQGVWKSTDAGATWTKVSKTGGPMDQGKTWGEAIDPNPNRNPATPPTMYAPAGNSSALGIYKSTDGGVNWTQTYTDPGGYGRDIYNIDIDPNNSQHVIATFHDSNKIVESKDGGATWIGRGAVAGATQSSYLFFVTSNVWLMVSQWTDTNGTYRSEDSGNTWTKVSTNEHFHGNCQPYFGPNGVLYLPGAHGIQKSTDLGKTWNSVFGSPENSVVATASYLYASDGWATMGTWDPNMVRSAVTDGTSWSSYTTKPGTMTNGTKRATVAFDGTHYVIISLNWDAGFWRYVEN
jgi:hypothetical protein